MTHNDLLSYQRRLVSRMLHLHIWKSLGTQFSSSRYLSRDSLQNGQNAIRVIFFVYKLYIVSVAIK